MKFTAIIFIVVLLAFSSAAAQTIPSDEILADGNEPLTQSKVTRVADFFEWSLEMRLSPAERAAFQNELVEIWKSENRREIAGVLYVLEVSGDIAQLSEADRREAQILIKESFLKALGRNESNKINALLLAGYRAKHGVAVDSSLTAVKQ
jgi:hypothetical protein